MAKFCSNCGKELNDNADICLNCGVLVNKQESKTNINNSNNNINNGKKKGLPVWAIVLIVLGCVVIIPLIIFIILGVFVFNTVKEEGGKYLDDAKDYYNDYVEDYDVIAEGTIGDSLEIDGVRFTLSEALKYDSIGDNTPMEGKEYLVFFFDVENASSKKNWLLI